MDNSSFNQIKFLLLIKTKTIDYLNTLTLPGSFYQFWNISDYFFRYLLFTVYSKILLLSQKHKVSLSRNLIFTISVLVNRYLISFCLLSIIEGVLLGIATLIWIVYDNAIASWTTENKMKLNGEEKAAIWFFQGLKLK